MEEYVIFERTVVRENEADNLFVRFACQQDNELQFVRATSVVFKESFQLMTPTMIVTFQDGSGDFINNNRLDNEAIFTLHFGKNIYDSYKMDFKIAHINVGNGISGQSKSAHFQVAFVHHGWEALTAERRTRGWGGVRFSDVVSAIAREGGFRTVDVEPSEGIRESILQSNWSDTTMMHYLQEHAQPQSGDGHYEFAGRLDDSFFFKSTAQLIQEGIQKYRSGDMPILRLGGQPPLEERDEVYSQNEQVPISFTDFTVNENYISSVSEGASSIESSYYDWHNRRYVRSTHRYQDLNSTQLSEWSLIRQGVDFVSKKLFGGRDPDVQHEARNQLSEVSHSMQGISINIEGQYTLHAGDVVEVIIPSSIGDSEVPYNEMYSGFWMISGVTHQLTLMNAVDFVSQLELVRHGLDGKSMKGYVRSSRGRARFSQ